ncbi:MAG: site-specific tyrosine recombinase/integron integrase [Candidatus Methanofastidiosia archaeon]
MLKSFEIELNLRGYSPITVKNYKNTLKNIHKFTNKPLKSLKPEDIKSFLFYLQKEKNNNLKSIHRHLNAIKTFYRINELDNAKNVRLPKVSKDLPVFLNIGEVQRLIVAAGTIRDRALVQTLYASGLRVSELVSLDRDSLEGTRINVRQGKGGKDRITYIDSDTLHLLSMYLKQRNDKEKALFINKYEKRISVRSVERIIKKMAKKANIDKKVTPHTLRHSFATHLLQNKANIVVIKDLLGHSNLSTTQIYTNLTNEYREEIYKKSYPLKNIEL